MHSKFQKYSEMSVVEKSNVDNLLGFDPEVLKPFGKSLNRRHGPQQKRDKRQKISKNQMSQITRQKLTDAKLTAEQYAKIQHETVSDLTQVENCAVRLWKLAKLEQDIVRFAKKHEHSNTDIEEIIATFDSRMFKAGATSRSFLLQRNLPISAQYFKDYIHTGFIPNVSKYDPTDLVGLEGYKESSFRKKILMVYAMRYDNMLARAIMRALHTFQKNKNQSFFSDIDFKGSATKVKDSIIAGLMAMKKKIEELLGDHFSGLAGKIMVSLLVISLLGTLIGGVMILIVSKYWISTIKNEPVVINVEEFQNQADTDKPKLLAKTYGESMLAYMSPNTTFDGEAFLNRLGRVTNSLNSVEKFVTGMWANTKLIWDWFYTRVFDEPFFESSRITFECRKDMEKMSDYNNQYMRDPSFLSLTRATEIKDITAKYRRLIASGLKHAIPGVYETFSNHILSCSAMVAAAENVSLSTKRVQPLWIHIMGEPGVGKTAFIDFLVKFLYFQVTGQKREVGELVHYRKPQREFWEGYAGQWCTVIDDFLQRTDQQTRSLESMELIDIANGAPLSLDMAQAESKGKVNFTSKVIITTSNFKRDCMLPDNLGLTSYDALYRRMHYKFMMYDAFPKAKEISERYNFSLVLNANVIGTSVFNFEVLATAVKNQYGTLQADYHALMEGSSDEKIDLAASKFGSVSLEAVQEVYTTANLTRKGGKDANVNRTMPGDITAPQPCDTRYIQFNNQMDGDEPLVRKKKPKTIPRNPFLSAFKSVEKEHKKHMQQQKEEEIQLLTCSDDEEVKIAEQEAIMKDIQESIDHKKIQSLALDDPVEKVQQVEADARLAQDLTFEEQRKLDKSIRDMDRMNEGLEAQPELENFLRQIPCISPKQTFLHQKHVQLLERLKIFMRKEHFLVPTSRKIGIIKMMAGYFTMMELSTYKGERLKKYCVDFNIPFDSYEQYIINETESYYKYIYDYTEGRTAELHLLSTGGPTYGLPTTHETEIIRRRMKEYEEDPRSYASKYMSNKTELAATVEHEISQCSKEVAKPFGVLRTIGNTDHSTDLYNHIDSLTRLADPENPFEDSVYAGIWESKRVQVLERIGEMIFRMYHGDLVAKKNHWLDAMVYCYDIRVLTFRTYGVLVPRVYFTMQPVPPERYYYHWQHQAVLMWTDPKVKGTDHKQVTMMVAKREQPKWWNFFQIRQAYHLTCAINFSKTNDIPQRAGAYPEHWDAEGLVLLKSLKTTRQEVWIEVGIAITAIGVALMATGLALMALKKFCISHFYPEDLINQSFDKATEERHKRHMRKPRPKDKVIMSPKKSAKKTQLPNTFVSHGLVNQIDAISPILPKFINNTEYVEFQGDENMSCYVLFIKSNVFVTTAHQFKFFNIQRLKFHWTKDEKIGTVMAQDYTVDIKGDRDVAVVTIRRSGLPLYKDLSKHLFSKKDYPKTHLDSIVKLDFTELGQVLLLHSTRAVQIQHEMIFDCMGQDNKIVDVWQVNGIKGHNGDCGLSYFTDNSKMLHAYMGLHNGGHGVAGCFSPVYLEDIPGDAQFTSQVLVAEDIWMSPERQTFRLNYISQKYYQGLRTIAEIKRDDKPHVVYANNRSALVNSGLGTFHDGKGVVVKPFVPTTKPAKLANYVDKDGVMHYPFKNAMGRFAVETRNDPGFKHVSKSKYFDGIFHKGVDLKLWKESTIHEALNGVQGAKYFGPVDMTSSSSIGASDVGLNMKDIIKGEPGKYRPSEQFEQLIERNLKMLNKGKAPPFVCIGTLKDETKNQEKIDKPRVFANGSKVALIVSRMIAGNLFEQILNHDGSGDIYIGINPSSHDWERLARKLSSKSVKKIIADDIEGWDIHMRLWFCEMLREEMIKRGADPKLANKFYLLAMSVLTPYVVLGDKIFRYIGMSSGSYLTAVFNSMYNSFMQRMLWDIKNPTLNFDEWLAQGVFGDDLVQAVKDALDKDLWNGRILAELRKKYFGVRTTSIYKDGRDLPEFMPLFSRTGLEEGVATFLKRQFRLENDTVFPALAKESIDSMLTWVRPTKDRSLDLCTKENIETALRELSFYPEVVYNTYFDYFQKYYTMKQWGPVPVSRKEQIMKYKA